ncbi:cytochrome P450 [Pilaira anomala]|nr:cytochrome P450 [Pilaira anomala]
MLLSENTFLQAPLQGAIQLYNKEIIPKLTKKNKVIAISAAVVLSLVYFIQDRILKPPRKLRHIPYTSFIGKLKSIWTGESRWDHGYRAHLPLIAKGKGKGLFLELSKLGWTLHVANPEDAKHVLLKLDLFPKADLPEGDENTLAAKFIFGPNIALLNGEHWKSQRKIANPAFRRSVPVELFGHLTQELFKTMETMDEVVNVSDLMERWTLEAIGRAGFGFKFNAISDRNNEWVKTYNYVNDGIRDPIYFLFSSLDTTFLRFFPKRQMLHKEWDKFSVMLDNFIKHKKEMVKQGVKNDDLKESEKDLLTLFIESGEENNGILSDEELKSNLCLFFLAGHDTTSSALTYAIHYLAENQDIQERARQEAISILGDEPRDILPSIEDTKKMTYINQVMKETLRINAPVPELSDRVTAEDTVLSDTFIPKGTPLTVDIFAIQHSTKLWKNPGTFDPDRFAEDAEVSRSGEGWSWLPFGNGARQCIGMNFSLTEQRVMLSMLLRKFTWVTPENSKHKAGLITAGFAVVAPVDLDIAFSRRY